MEVNIDIPYDSKHSDGKLYNMSLSFILNWSKDQQGFLKWWRFQYDHKFLILQVVWE